MRRGYGERSGGIGGGGGDGGEAAKTKQLGCYDQETEENLHHGEHPTRRFVFTPPPSTSPRTGHQRQREQREQRKTGKWATRARKRRRRAERRKMDREQRRRQRLERQKE